MIEPSMAIQVVLAVLTVIGTAGGVFISMRLVITRMEQDLKDFKEHTGVRLNSQAGDIDKLFTKHERHIIEWHK